MKYNVVGEKPDWNMAVAYLQRLDEQFGKAHEAAVVGNVMTWFRVLRVIYRLIHFKLREDSDKKLKDGLELEFNVIKRLLVNRPTGNRGVDSQMVEATIGQAEEKLDLLDMKLNDVSYDKGFVFGKRDFKSFDQEIEEDY